MRDQNSAFTALPTEDLEAFLDGVPEAVAVLAMYAAQERVAGNEAEALEYEDTIRVIEEMKIAVEFELKSRGES